MRGINTVGSIIEGGLNRQRLDRERGKLNSEWAQ